MIEENTVEKLLKFCETLLAEGSEITIELIQQNFCKEEQIEIKAITYDN